MLIEHESIWFQAWQAGADSAKRGLRSPLIVAEVDPEVAAAHQQQVKANRTSAGADADGNAAASGRQMDIDEVILGATLQVNLTTKCWSLSARRATSPSRRPPRR